jgi:hypothetical protein
LAAHFQEKGKNMTACVNLFDVWGPELTPQGGKSFELVHFNGREVAVIPFTSTSAYVKLHYIDDPEFRGYVHCNGADCALCRLGRPVEERALLPVYLPAQGTIGVIAISPSSRPGALRPQLLPLLRSGKQLVLFIKKQDQMTFSVGSKEVGSTQFRCDKLIADFQHKLEAGEIDLASAYPRMSNEALAKVPGIGTMLQLKGVTVGAGSQG